jgi:glyoxylase-like metal-dependent hydrolase (beta-lactamase superfamily II)
MTIATIRIGHVEVTALLDGVSDDIPITEAFPDAPEDALRAERERFPGVYGDPDTWRLHVRAWLVRHPGGELLMDTGVGSTVAMGWFPEPGRLHEALAEAGTSAHRLETVVLSHVHDDHVGGVITVDGELAFPNARHVIQRADLDAARAAGTAPDADDEDARVWHTLLAPLEAAGAFDVVEGDTPLADGLELHHAPGHTPGHQVMRIGSEGRRALLSADTWNHPSQFAHPDWTSGPDADPARAAATRRSLLAGLLSRPGTVVAPTHFAEAFGRVASGRDGLATWEPVG